MSDIKVSAAQAAMAPVSTPAIGDTAPVVVKTIKQADAMGATAPKIGVERAKLSALQAPATSGVVRGSSRVADASDLIWGAAMGALWANAISN